jgi:two-component system OmpR family sensor kinase
LRPHDVVATLANGPGTVRTTLATFRSRLIVAITAATLLTLGIAFAAIAVAVGHSQLRQLDDALRAEAIEEAAEAAQLGGTELAIDPGPGPTANDIGPLTKYGALYGPSGDVLGKTATFRDGVPPLASLGEGSGRAFNLELPWEHLRAVLVALPGHQGSRMLLAAPRTDVDRDAAFLRRAMLIVFAVAVAWSVATATWVAGAFTRDHQAIASVVRRVAAGDLSARVAKASGNEPMAKLAADVNDMVAALGILVESEQRFVAQAAHELRSPLTTLYGELSHALRRTRNAEAYRDAIGEALDSTRRLKLLAEDLLALFQLGTGDRVEPPRTTTVSALIRAGVDAVQEEARTRGIRITVEGDDALIEGHARDLERMVRNLLENATRHAPAGSTVRVASDLSGDNVALRIIDQGPGVPEAERSRIFEPFYRCVRDRSAATGTGLGLAIVREIARAHGGDVGVEPASADGGAEFVVRLPRSRLESPLAVTPLRRPSGDALALTHEARTAAGVARTA